VYLIVYIILWLPSYAFLMATYGAMSQLASIAMIGVTLIIFKKAFFVMYPNGYYWSRRNNNLFIVVFLGQIIAIYLLFLLLERTGQPHFDS